MTFKKFLLTITVSCAFLAARAQDDKATYSFDFGRSKPTDTRFTQNSLKIKVPLKAATKSHFIIGAEAGILKVQHSLSVADSSSLKTIGLILGYQAVLDNKARLVITAEPLLASDLTNLSGNDYRFKSDVFYTPFTTHKLAFGFGLAYQYQFSGSQLLPVVIPVWHISDKVTLTGAFPIIPRLEVKLDQHWSIGAGLNVNYGSYRLSGFNNQYMQTQNISFGFTPKYRVAQHLEVSSFIGFGSRRLDIYNADQKIPLRIYSWDIGGGSHTPNYEQRFKGLALNLTVGYRFD